MIDTFQLGDITLHRVVESTSGLLHPGELFPDWRIELLDQDIEWLKPRYYDAASDGLMMVIQSFLLKTPHHIILVDTCSGNHKDRARPFFNQREWPWLKALAATGTHPNDIDIVLCSHLHVDHIGWNTQLIDGRWVPTFPNAKYLFSKDDFSYWEEQYATDGLVRTGDYFSDSVLPIIEAGQAELVNGDYQIEDKIVLQLIPGHSPGQVAVNIGSGDGLTVLCGDLMHHPLQCQFPDWSTNFCVDAEQARVTRRRFFETHADQNTLVVPAHFPAPTAGRIVAGDIGYGFRYFGE